MAGVKSGVEWLYTEYMVIRGGNTSGRFAGMHYGSGRQIQPLVCHRPGRWDAGWSGVRPVCGINQLHDVIQWRLRSGFIEHRNGKMPLGDLSGMG